ncbi:MAG: MFS transporter [Proteobacteria bacterium]|nr:MFS transporter [Pseudomonadota bacterium]
MGRAASGGAVARIFFGWKVVAAAFTLAVFAWGSGLYGPPVFLHALHSARGWSVSLIGAAITTHFLVSAGVLVQLAELHRRFGVAATTGTGGGALALGVIAWAAADAPWQLFGAALVSGVGWGATSGAAIAAMIRPWFRRRLPLAFNIAYNGASFGGVIFTPVWLVLIERFGFASAAVIVGVATAGAMAWLAQRYLRPTPAALGLAPDGAAVADTASEAPDRPPRARRALMRERRFITLTGAAAIGIFAQIGLVALLVALLAVRLGADGAAAAVSLTTACAIGGRLLVGLLPRAADWRVVSAANVAMQACGVLLMATAATTPALLAGCALFGLGLGNLVSLPPLIAQIEYERPDAGRAVALVTGITQAVSAFAPVAFGTLHDLAGGFSAPLAAAAVLQLAAAAIVLIGRRRPVLGSPA